MDPAAGNNAAPPAGAVLLAVAAAAAPAPPARTLPRRATVAKAFFVLGCAAAALAIFAMTLNPDNSRFLGPSAPTDAEAGDLRAMAEALLLAAAGQVLVSTVAVRAPARPFAISAVASGAFTARHVYGLLLWLAACHDHVAGALATYYVYFICTLVAALEAGVVVSTCGDD